MKLAFCIFNYFPYGGLQGDFLRIALECRKRGHDITVYTRSWHGDIPDGFKVITINVSALTNHGKAKAFAGKVKILLNASPADCVIGFNRIPGLDIYFAGDNCLAETFQGKSLLKRLLNPRYSAYIGLEQAVFSPGNKTEILLITERQRHDFVKHYGTEETRFHLLPPGIPADRHRPPDADAIRRQVRTAMHVADDTKVLIQVGSGFKTKGVSRSIQAIAALPETLRKKTILWIVGRDDPKRFIEQARQMNIAERIIFTGGRDDVPQLLLAADLMLHPAINEAAGNALLEALASGLPVICSAACGYAGYIEQANAGAVIPEPFSQEQMNASLTSMLTSGRLPEYGNNGYVFAGKTDLYSRATAAADIIFKKSKS